MVREHLFLFAVLSSVFWACGGETFRRGPSDDAGAAGEESGGNDGVAGKGGTAGVSGGRGGNEPGSGGSDGSGSSGRSGAGRSGSQGGSTGTAGSAGSDNGDSGEPSVSDGGDPGVAGGSSGSANAGGTGGSAGTANLPIVDPVPAPDGAHQLPGGDTYNSTPPVLAALSDGIVIAGYTTDPTLAGVEMFEPGQVAEVFAAHLDRSGQVLWSTPLPGSAIPSAIAVDASGDIVIVSAYLADRRFTIYRGSYTNDLYVAKLRQNGDLVYARDIPFDSGVIPYGMTVDPTGAIYVVGAYMNPDMSNNAFAFLAKYDADGFESWTNKFTHSGTWASADGVAVLPGGDVAITGGFNGTLSLGGEPLTTAAGTSSSGSSNGYLARYSPNGEHQKSTRFGGTIFDLGKNLLALSDGDLVVAGSISGTATLGGKTATGHEGEGSPFVARVAPDGNARWFEVAPSRGFPYTLVADPDESLFHLGGLFSGNYFLFEFGPNGELPLAATVSGTEIWTNALAVDSQNSLWAAGGFQYDVDFGGGAAFEAEDRGVFLVRLERTERAEE